MEISGEDIKEGRTAPHLIFLRRQNDGGGAEGVSSITITSIISEAYRDMSQGANIFYPEKGAPVSYFPLRSLRLDVWYAGIWRALGRIALSSLGMFGILSLQNVRYVGYRSEELGIGK